MRTDLLRHAAGTRCLLVLLWLLPDVAAARPLLRPLPVEVIQRNAATLTHGELAIIDSLQKGQDPRVPQITVLGYAAAPPAVVYALVADPSLYWRYIRNLSRSDVAKLPDGALRHHWKVSYPIGSFEGFDELRLLPATGGSPGAVDIRVLGEGKVGVARWEFWPAPGGGTLVVNAGCYDPLDNRLLQAMIGRNPELDAGFNLAGALAVMRSLLAAAARDAQAAGLRIAPPPEQPADLAPLLARGTVAIVRTAPGGRLVDVSVVERIPASLPILGDLLRAPQSWPQFLKPVVRVEVTQRDAAGIEYRMAVAGILFDVVTDYRMNFTPDGTDTLGLSGMMKGSRYRWDLRADGPMGSIVVWRGNLHLGDSSGLVRSLFRMEPSFEPSANVSVGLISMRAIAKRAIELVKQSR